MNFSQILNKQNELDKAIKEVHTIDIGYNEKMLIALYTEIGEFANEVQSFKYWKKQKNIDQEKLLEEYADGLHFLMSFAIKLKCSNEIKEIIKSNDINDQFLHMFNSVGRLTKKLSKKRVETAIGIYLGLAHLLNITEEQVIDAYLKKNNKNFERLKNNY